MQVTGGDRFVANTAVLYPIRVERKVVVTLSDGRRLSGCATRLSQRGLVMKLPERVEIGSRVSLEFQVNVESGYKILFANAVVSFGFLSGGRNAVAVTFDELPEESVSEIGEFMSRVQGFRAAASGL